MITEKRGDLLNAKENIIAHQVNCKGVMGAGIAKLIKNNLLTGKQFDQYRKKCLSYGADLLGTCYLEPINGRQNQYVANLFGENIPTGKTLDTDYNALESAIINLKLTARQHQMSIAIPGYIGCGLAGGDWDYVYKYILVPHFKSYRYGLSIIYIMDSIRMLWKDFGDVPIDPVTECIEVAWHGFAPGTHREVIWKWFEDTFQISVAEDLMNC